MTEHPSFDEVVEALQNTESPLQASEVHGLICGILCATSGKENNQWEKLVVGPKKSKSSQARLQQLYDATREELHAFSFEFTLLLPNDETGIDERAEALGLFCEGFLTGLKQSGAKMEGQTSDEVADAIHDLTEISQVKYDDISGSEEDENAFFELAEYVRLVVLMIFHELKTGERPSTLDDNNLLH